MLDTQSSAALPGGLSGEGDAPLRPGALELLLVGALLIYTVLTQQAGALPVAGIACLLCILVPTERLPSIALYTLALIPAWQLSGIRFLGDFGLAPVLLTIWAFRSGRGRARHGASRTGLLRGVGFFLLVSVGLSWFLSDDRLFVWPVSLLACVVLPLIANGSARTRVTLAGTWMAVGAAVGSLAVIEQTLQGFPLVDAMRQLHGVPEPRGWSVYRSMVTFTHPLYLGMFLAVGSAVSLGTWLRTGRFTHLVMLFASVVGTVATVSRGSLLAIAAGGVVVWLAVQFGSARSVGLRSLRLAAVGLVALVGVANSPLLLQRQASSESFVSAQARSELLRYAPELALQRPVEGWGPGTSSRVAARQGITLVLENGWMQAWVSLGALGLGALIAVVAAVFWTAFRSREFAALAGMTTFAVAFAGFNAFDDVYFTHALLGLLIVLVQGAGPTAALGTVPRPTGSGPRMAARPR